MRIVFLGSGAFGGACLEWLLGADGRQGHQILEVITQPARPAGRGRKKHITAIAELAAKLDLSCREVDNVNKPEIVEHIRSLQPEILLVIAFGQWIGSELLNLTDCRVINLHSSLLPKYRGAAPINWAIIKGEKQTGLTIIELNDVWDGGAVLGQLATEIQPQETAGELHDRLARLGPQLLEEVLGKISKGGDTPLPQDESQACPAPKLRKGDGAIHWDQPAEQIRNLIHGTWPWPGASCYLQQTQKKKPERISIARVEVVRQELSVVPTEGISPPGTIDENMNIICGTDRLKLLQLRPENGKMMDFNAFVNGRHLKTGDRFLDG